MKVMITGGNGMVGRSLREHPAAAAHQVVAPGSEELDLTRKDAVCAFVSELRPDVVIHAAGRVGGIHYNMAHQTEALVDNTEMGFNIVLAAKAVGVPRLINLGSSCMYPREAPNPLSENVLLSGNLEPTNEGYALAKNAVSRLCLYISRSQPALQYKTLIPCNLYGVHDKFDPGVSHLVSAIIEKVDKAKRNGHPTVEIWGDGTVKREFLLASDLADAIWTGVERFPQLPEIMNVGCGIDYTVNEYYEAVARVVGWDGEFVHDLTKPVGMLKKVVCTERQKAFGWAPRHSLDEGLRTTYDHYRTHVMGDRS